MSSIVADVCEMLVETANDVNVVRSARACLSLFGDGHCDSDCDNEEALFDGFDCISSAAAAAAGMMSECDGVTSQSKAASRRPQCSAVYADGTCDDDCDSAACLWDGGDCIGTALR